MKTIVTINEMFDEISVRLRAGDVRIIGIDGKDGSGKSYLADLLSKKYAIDILCFDDFVEKKQGGYLRYLDVSAIRHRLQSRISSIIIEGVCLLAAAKLIGAGIDIHIYVKRMSSYGTWRDEEECDPSVSPEDLIEKLEDDLKNFTRIDAALGGNSPRQKEDEENDEINLPELVKELIRYHANYRPATRADYSYERREA